MARYKPIRNDDMNVPRMKAITAKIRQALDARDRPTRPGGRTDVPVWSAFCESLGTRCTHVNRGVRCDGGTVGTTDRCTRHKRKGTK